MSGEQLSARRFIPGIDQGFNVASIQGESAIVANAPGEALQLLGSVPPITEVSDSSECGFVICLL